MRSYALSFAVMFGLVVMFVVASVATSATPRVGNVTQYAAVFAPGTSTAEVIENIIAAGAKPVRTTFFDFIIIGATDDPDFARRAHENGAVFVFNPLIQGGCITENKTAFARKV